MSTRMTTAHGRHARGRPLAVLLGLACIGGVVLGAGMVLLAGVLL